MRRILFLLFLGLLALNLHGQTKRFIIDWEGLVNVSTGSIPRFVPGFQKQNFSYSDEYGILFTADFGEQVLPDPETASVSDIVYEILPPSELGSVLPESIADDTGFSISVSTAREKSKAQVTLNALVKKGGVYKKVTAFTVNYSRSSRSGLSSRNSPPITNSIFATGSFYKFYVDKTGIFKIDRNFLNSLGMNVSQINPANIKIYGNGGAMLPLRNEDNTVFDPRENAIKVVGGEDGSFDNGDYIMFYGEGTRQFNEESLTHVNAYDDRSYYFITADGSPGLRVQPMQEPSGAVTREIITFDDYQFHEIDSENLLRLGRRWFGERFDFENERQFDFAFPNRVQNEPVKIRVYTAAISESQTAFEVSLNGVPVTTQNILPINESILARDSFYDTYRSPSSSPAIIANGEDLSIKLVYSNNGNPSSVGFLDFVALEAVRNLTGAGNQLAFRKNNTAGTGGVGAYILSNASQFSEVWDVSDPQSITFKENSEGSSTFTFKSNLGVLKNFIAVNMDDFFIPLRENGTPQIVNQNLKGTIFNGPQGFRDLDYLIVTNDMLRPQAERLAEHNRRFRGLNVGVATLNEIYNEFSSGKADIGAIRNFVRYIYENASSPAARLKYLCLFGDTSIDYKDRLPNNNNIVPTFNTYYSFSESRSYMSDDYFGSIDPGEGVQEDASPAGSGGSDRLDIAVGRILADTPQLARQVTDKIISYDSPESLGRWRNNFVLVSDDVDLAWEHTQLQTTIDQLGNDIQREKPFINVVKIHSDSYQQESSAGGDRYPQVNEAISDAIEVGALVLTYLGHGGENTLASEFIFTRSDVEKLNNQERLPLIVTVTCEFTRFDNPNRPAAGENLFWNSNGGAVGLVATTREISVMLGVTFNEQLAANLFSFGTNTIKSVAENLRETKNRINDSRRRVIFFIGDPAMKLAFAKPDIRITGINGEPFTQANDTLKALDRVRISGEVITQNGQLISDFNGGLSATLFDKYADRQTLANDGTRDAAGNLLILDFKELGPILYRGQASVSGGQFDFEFVLPKDTRIPVGNGRINFYAQRDGVAEDFAGANEQIKIGGLNENAPLDNQGPVINLYMNDESFVNGGITNSSPFLLVKLEDENGINTASGIGHDLIAILDGDETNPIILNDFYESDPDNFTLGKALRKLRDLEPGLHTVTVIAWDTYNNSSSADLQFVVAGNQEMKVENVLNYPNPFVDYTEFWFNHNRPFEPLDVQVQIFTISGKVVKTINQSVVTSGFLSRDITWDGRDDFGARIGKGVYIYKITVKSTLSNKQVEKFEKLVIL